MMPEDERRYDGGPEDDEYIPWDFDNDTASESEVHDLLSEEDEDSGD